jgi:endonuclease/exonuclease/phosphatase family metal-dependent hydrolase
VPAPGFPDAAFVPFRCDHVLLSPALAPALTRYRVIDDDHTGHACDHLPVVVEAATP